MHFSRALSLGLALAGLCALDNVAARPAAAQELTYTLDGVTFNDGAAATGSFDFNPTSQTFGNYDITTTNGVTDALIGTHYTQSSILNQSYVNAVFVIESGTTTISTLVLDTTAPVTGPGTFSLRPGALSLGGGFTDSGELTAANGSRVVTTGSLIVTPAAVPEASTTASFGVLLALGMGGVVTARRRKTTAKTSA